VQVLLPSLKRDAQQGARRLRNRLALCASCNHAENIGWRVDLGLDGNIWSSANHCLPRFPFKVRCYLSDLSLPGIPVNGLAALTATAEGFKTLRTSTNPLYGCVAAIDGIAIRIRSPRAIDLPSLYYCRNGCFALPVQACCDSKYSFLFFSAKAVGSSHDSLAFLISSLHFSTDGGGMPAGFWIAADAAYTCTDYLPTPFSKTVLPASGFQTSRDAYNFYQSSHRVNI
jgi:hypothetical protein